jgi:hypothetical protein
MPVIMNNTTTHESAGKSRRKERPAIAPRNPASLASTSPSTKAARPRKRFAYGSCESLTSGTSRAGPTAKRTANL